MKDIVVSVASSEVSLVDGAASMTVSVQNQTAAPERIVLSTVVPPDDPGLAISIERSLREVPAGMMEQYLVTFARGDAAPGRYDLKFIASPSEEATEEYAERAGRLSVVVPAPEEKPPPPFRWWPIAAAALAILVVVGVVAFVLTRSDSVAVPDVMGRTQADAQRTLTSAGLRTAVKTTPGIKPLGVVASQQPAAGTEVKEDTEVTIVVRSTVELLNLTAMTLEEAQAQLKAIGFTTVTTVKQESPMAAGTVVKQDPQPGTAIALDDEITLTVSTPVLVEVPDVVGLSLPNALSVLQRLGLPVSRGGCGVLCRVVSQQPAPGKRVPPGTRVTLGVESVIIG